MKALRYLQITLLQERRSLCIVYGCIMNIMTFLIAFVNAHMPVDAAFCKTAKHPTLLSL